MSKAFFRFYGELNFFLDKEQKETTFSHSFFGSPGIKDTIEALGVPHPEVKLIIVNGEVKDFEYNLIDGDRASIYPKFRKLTLPDSLKPETVEINQYKFLIDNHLDKLARFLRMLVLIICIIRRQS